MDFYSLLTVMARRWFVVLPVLAVTLVVGLSFVGSPEELYVAEGSELLRTRTSEDLGAADSQEIDPAVAATVLATAFEQPAEIQRLTAEALPGEITAAVDQSGSIITLTVASDDAAVSASTAAQLLELAPSLLDNVVGADASSSVRLTQLSSPVESDAVEVNGDQVVTTYVTVLAPANVANPFPPANSTTQLLVELSRRVELADAVSEAVPGGSFEVGEGGAITTPVIAIRATAGAPGDVGVVYSVVVDQLGAQLIELQEEAGVAAIDQTVLFPLVEPTLVERASSSVVRAAAGVALLGLAAAAVLAIVVDAYLRRRAERKVETAESDDSDELDDSEDEPEDSKRTASKRARESRRSKGKPARRHGEMVANS
ncbi:MAG: hypothetical protein AAGA42_08735 [Actinomycetota bacterium]